MQLTGQTINGYKFLNFINKGGFGSVYKAEKNGVSYAVKVFEEEYVLREFKQHGEENNRLKREIEIMKSIRHDNLVEYIDDFVLDEEAGKKYFLVMEYIEGKNLRQILREQSTIEEKESLRIFLEVLKGVRYLHSFKGEEEEAGVIHRDLKPDNILISNSGNIKIVDFGISKVIDFTSITNTGEVFGTGPYMSPEQITDSKNIDKRSDLYTLGVILYEMLTGSFPYDFQFQPELIEKIKNEPAIPPRRKNFHISNKIENLILKLLEKNAYQRFSTAKQILDFIASPDEKVEQKLYDLSPRFILRLYDDKTVLEEYTKKDPHFGNVIFPANLENHQKNLKQNIQENPNIKIIIDPSTVRLAYDTYIDTKGLCELPYAPEDYSVITPSYLQDYKKQKKYVQQVIDKQIELQSDILLSPFHYTHNSSIAYTPNSNPIQEWFDLDCKLIRESIDYRNEQYPEKEIYAGICIKADSLKDEKNKKFLLNVFSSFESDGFLIYADGIDANSSEVLLYQYLHFLRELQAWTKKPVIAGRVNIATGLGITSLGIAGFTLGTARFESFSEDLYKERQDAYNMGIKYYFPELLSSIFIKRKEPVKFDQISHILGFCDCFFCKGKDARDIIKDKNTKLHFLEQIHKEVASISRLSAKDRIGNYIYRLDSAINTYQELKGVFKPDDYSLLGKLKNIFSKFNENHV